MGKKNKGLTYEEQERLSAYYAKLLDEPIVEEPKKALPEEGCNVKAVRANPEEGIHQVKASKEYPLEYQSNDGINPIYGNKKKKNKKKNKNRNYGKPSIDGILKGKQEDRGLLNNLGHFIEEKEEPAVVVTEYPEVDDTIEDGFEAIDNESIENVFVGWDTESTEPEDDFTSARIFYVEDEEAFYVYNNYISNENLKPDAILSLKYLFKNRSLPELLSNYENGMVVEDIKMSLTKCILLTREPDFILTKEGLLKVLSKFTDFDYDLITVFSYTPVTNDDTEDYYLVYVNSPNTFDDSDEILDIFNSIEKIYDKLPKFISTLRDYMTNPLVSPITKIGTLLDELTVPEMNENADKLINYLTDPEVNQTYQGNTLYDETKDGNHLGEDDLKKIVTYNASFISVRLSNIIHDIEKIISGSNIKNEQESVNTDTPENDKFEDINEDDIPEENPDSLIIDKIIPEENSRD